MKYSFKAHPLMILSLLRPFWFILIIPVIKIVLQFLITGKMSGFLFWEIVALIIVTLIGIIRWRSFSFYINGEKITINKGFIIKTSATLDISLVSSVKTVRNPLDRLFRAVSYEINTEAGLRGKTDFSFKLGIKDAERISRLLYGESSNISVKFSIFKLAFMSATTSSVVTGIIVAVPLIKRAGDLLGIAIGEILFNRIHDTASKVELYFPPIVNIVTIVFVAAYLVAFCYSLLKNINLRIRNDDDKVSVSSGFIVKRKTTFKKNSINNLRIEQTPLMRFFGMFSLDASVGGFGGSRKESATVVPCAKRRKIKEYANVFFPFLCEEGEIIRPHKNESNRARFLFKPMLFSAIAIAVVVITVAVFDYFDRLMLFLMVVSLSIILYYANLCIYNYHHSKLCIGENTLTARGIGGFHSRELRLKKEKIGVIKITRYPSDIRHNTCKLKITVRSESADRLRLLHLDYDEVRKILEI